MSVTVKHPFVSTVPDSADTSLVRPSNWNADHTITGLGTAAEKDVGVANGVASLDSGGKVPVSELPAAVLGALSYQGTWNASTNTPTLASGVGTKGYYYVVSVAGSTNLDGVTDWLIGDWAVYNGTAWQKVDNTDTVTSVNGQTGTVVLTTTDVAEGTNEYFTTARARASVSAGTGISYDSGTGVITNASPSLGGDVVGPASATDNAIARFDATTGKLIQNSVVTVSDTGAISGVIEENFTPVTPPAYVEGKVFYDTDAKTLCYYNDNTQMTVNLGQETIVRVRNQTGSAINNGTVVYVNGATGNTPTIALAIATSFATSDIIGVTTTDIANNGFGYVTINGLVNGIDTNAFNEGDAVFLSDTTPGAYTTTEPIRPNYSIQVGVILRKSPVVGTLLVSVQIVSTETTHIIGTVAVDQGGTGQTSYTNGQLLIGNTTGNTLTKSTLTAGTGISVTNGSGSITITNTAPSSGGTVTSVGGTGTVSGISLSGTVTTSGDLTLGGTLDLSSPPAIGGTTPSTGKFSNLEYTGTLTGGTGVIAIGTNQIYKDASGNVGIGTASPATDLDVAGPAGVTSFTGTTKLGVAVRGSTAATDYSGIDFYGNSQTNPTARIGVLTTGSGSFLQFGTSNAYGSGITKAAMTINDDGLVGVGTTNPADDVGFGAAVDVQGSLGGGLYLRDIDNPSLYAYIGYIGSNAATYVWNVATGPILFGTNNAERMRVASGGAVSIGKAVDTVTGAGLVNDPSGLIRVTRTGTSSATMIQFANNGGTQVGSISTSGSTTTYSTSSDYRLKENVSPMTGALAKVQALKPVTYTWKNDGSQGQGFIAHELQEIIPDCVTGVKDAIEAIDEVDAEGRSIGTKEVPVYQGVDTSFLVATLVAAIQEQQALISQLQADVATLKGN